MSNATKTEVETIANLREASLIVIRETYAAAKADRHAAAMRGDVDVWHVADAWMADMGRQLADAEAGVY